MPTNTAAANDKKANEFFHAALPTIDKLLSRWESESEYENINDYKIPLAPLAEQHGVTIIKMLKRPFGCEFSLGGNVYKMTMSASGKCKLVCTK